MKYDFTWLVAVEKFILEKEYFNTIFFSCIHTSSTLPIYNQKKKSSNSLHPTVCMVIENLLGRKIINEVFQNQFPVHNKVLHSSIEELKD